MRHQVYAYGMISASTLHVLEEKYPEPDGYAEIKETLRMIGGEAANSSIVLSKLGIKVKLDGNWLGENSNGMYTQNLLESFNIDVSRLVLKENYRGVEENVFTDGLTRTNFGTYCKLLFTEKQWNIPLKQDIEDSQIVCLDPFFKEETLLISKICTELNKPYVTIDCKYTNEIAKEAQVLIISGEFRKNEYRDEEKETLFKKYTDMVKGLVIFTSGGSDILYGRKGGSIERFKPYEVEPVDTAGAGDSFRSGIIYGLLQNWSDKQIIHFASALAAYICITFPGVLNCPDYEGVVNFMKERSAKMHYSPVTGI